MTTATPTRIEPRPANLSPHDPKVSWWLYHVVDGVAMLYRCDTAEECWGIRDELYADGASGLFGRLDWRQNEYNARRKMWLRGWQVAGVR